MAPNQQKRARPVPANSQRSKKRQKVETAAAAKVEYAAAAVVEAGKEVASDVRKIPVGQDSLPWNEVEMPDMFDDAEGFFGLEEVDDVEVIKEGNSYKFLSKKLLPVEDEEEFEGFGDDEPVSESKETKNTQLGAPVKAKETKEKKDKKKKKPKKAADVPDEASSKSATPTNIFAALEEDTAHEDIDMSAWNDIDLSPETLSALAKMGFTTPTKIQAAAIPEVLEGRDVIGKASTGSGKTLAFGIPIVEAWLQAHNEKNENSEDSDKPHNPLALILSPTRELAHQLTEHLKALCAGLSDAPFVAAVTGGLSVQKQQRQLTRADIVIGTPGRLWEVMGSSIELTRAFKAIKFLVVDEADRLLTEGHFKEATEIINSLDRQVDADEDEEYVPNRQTLIFSATFAKELQQKLAGKGKYGLMDKGESMEYLLKKLNFREEKPKFVDVNPVSQMAEGLKEGMVECAGTEKDLYLYSLLMYHPNQRTLIFTNSIHSVRRLLPLLQNLNVPVHGLHSQMAQKARMRSIERFASPAASSAVLVATDVAARGLDISGVQLVIHYHLPRSADMYVHRSGRTARASASGSSILLCCPEEVQGMRRLVAKVHAQNAVAGGGSRNKYYMRSLDIDRKVVARLKPRVMLAKKIADSGLAKEKKGHDDDWVRTAAEELGVDYDSEEFEAAGGGKKGRGTGRKEKEKQARSLSKGEVAQLRGELKSLLSQRVNVGVSERYLTGSSVDINELLKGAQGDFLGKVDGIGLDD